MPSPEMTPEQMANVPLAPHPQLGYSYIPNFDHPETNGPQTIALCSFFFGLTALVVVLRLISRVKVVKRTGLDDWTSVAALLSCAVSDGLVFWLIDHKIVGPHAWDVRLVTYIEPQVSQALFGLQIMGNTANFFAKASILLFIQRLFPRQICPKTAYAVWFGLLTNLIVYAVFTIYLGVSCTPKNGDFPARCSIPLRLRLAAGGAAVNAILDFYILSVSIPALWMLRMPLRRRISVIVVLGVGLIACGLSTAILVIRAINNPAVDTTREQVTLIILGTMEPQIATITACLPAMPALWTEICTKSSEPLRRIFSRIRSTTSMNSSKKASQYNDIDDGYSMKSLNSHGLPMLDNVERGDKIQVQTTFTTTTTQRDG